jgi:hypothetical protein
MIQVTPQMRVVAAVDRHIAGTAKHRRDAVAWIEKVIAVECRIVGS